MPRRQLSMASANCQKSNARAQARFKWRRLRNCKSNHGFCNDAFFRPVQGCGACPLRLLCCSPCRYLSIISLKGQAQMPGTGWYLRLKVPFLGYCSRFRKSFQVVAAMLPELNHVDTLLGQGAAKRKNVITGGYDGGIRSIVIRDYREIKNYISPLITSINEPLF